MRTLLASLALVLAGCGYQPVDPPPGMALSVSPPPPGKPPSALAEFVGDQFGVVTTSKIYSSLSQPGKGAFLRLANARIVTSVGIGISGSRSPLSDAFYELLQDPRAREAFGELAQSDNPHAVLYGIAGLMLTDPPAANRFVRRWMGSRAPVETMSGCVGSSSSLDELLSFDPAGNPVVWNEYWAPSLARPSRPGV